MTEASAAFDGRGTPNPLLAGIPERVGAPGEPAAAADPAPAGDVPTERRILVVDDDPVVRALARRVLAVRGHTVQEANDGIAALLAVERDPPDLILMDLLMPRLDGLGAMARLRALGIDIPVLVFSVVDAHPALRGAPFLAKPFRPDQLLAAVDAALAGSEPS